MSRQCFYTPLLFIALSVIPLRARAEDWPQWRGPLRTGHVQDGAPVPQHLPASPRVIWRVDVGEGFASPVLAGGKVFSFDNQGGQETLHALDAINAHELWRATVDSTFSDEQGPPGPRCTPTVDGDRIYAQSGKGELQCRQVSDGRLVWRVNFTNDFGAAFQGEDTPIPGAAEHGYTAAPMVEGNKLIACVGGTNGAGIVCFEKMTGKLLWKSQNDRAAYAAPIVATLAGVSQAVCFSVEGLLGLSLTDGSLLWRFPLKTPYGRNCTTPVVLADCVVVGSYRAGLVGAKVNRAMSDWKAERAWVNRDAAMNFSSPVIVDGYLYGLGQQRRVVCVEVVSGQMRWSQPGYFESASEVAFASFMVLGKNILMSTDGGELVLLSADPGGCKELGRARVCGQNWCSPAYAEGRLYLRDGIKTSGSLYCLELIR